MQAKGLIGPGGLEMQRKTRLTAALLIIFIAYGLAFIARTSFVVDGERYFCLQDDAMISMRYAAQAASGFGLRWNPGGEAVEGFTNPLWTAVMTVAHLAPVPASKVSLAIQLLSLMLLTLNVFLTLKLAECLFPALTSVHLAAACLTAFYFPLNNWALQGMEVGALVVAVTGATWLFARGLQADRFTLAPYLMLGVSTAVRMDMAAPLMIATASMAWSDRRRWKIHLASGVITGAAFLAAQTGWRLLYFGDVLPNTYYLKLAGFPVIPRLTRGLFTAIDFVWNINWLLVLGAAVYVWVDRRPSVRLAAAIVAGQMVYSVYVGGDAWEAFGGSNRYVSIAMPLFFVLLAATTWRALLLLGFDESPTRARRSTRLAMIAATVAIALTTNTFRGPTTLRSWLLLAKPFHVLDNEARVREALALRRITGPRATVAVAFAGAGPYFLGRHAEDMLGKCDRRIARLPMHISRSPSETAYYLWMFYPGHLKWDYAYSIGEKRPDVVWQLWRDEGSAAPHLREYDRIDVGGVMMWLRRGSPHIQWDLANRSRAAPPMDAEGGS